ncbi:hypothetical protein BDW59DRAFT_167650 [Aspergillus cavernicola]|uniref:Nephrocystin 3-like N-terminal domain-containing protein n=1 Tax=Aspergillus cavernicola TaxID=176166 RepID=A0ABR4HC66_9EURO
MPFTTGGGNILHLNHNHFDFALQFEHLFFSIIPSALFGPPFLWRTLSQARKPIIVNAPALLLINLQIENIMLAKKDILPTINHSVGNCEEIIAELQTERSGGVPERSPRGDITPRTNQIDQVSSIIRDWLKAPDAATNHDSASSKRHQGSGTRFIKGHPFQSWLADENSFLWLNGFARCGKSVLCSTAIQYTMRLEWDNPGYVGVAFFYFTFGDESNQDASAMIRAFLLQLSAQHQECQADLTRLHRSYHPWVPTTEIFAEYLRGMIRRFQEDQTDIRMSYEPAQVFSGGNATMTIYRMLARASSGSLPIC